MFDKWKAKRELVKAFKFYRKEYKKANKHYYDTFNTEFQNKNYGIIDEAYDNMQYLNDILKALAYVLYSNFNMGGMEDMCWISTYYDLYKDKGKKYIEKISKQNNIITEYNDIAWSSNDFFKGNYSKGDVVYNMENGCLYMYDGKNFINMCLQTEQNMILYNHQMKVRYII